MPEQNHNQNKTLCIGMCVEGIPVFKNEESPEYAQQWIQTSLSFPLEILSSCNSKILIFEYPKNEHILAERPGI